MHVTAPITNISRGSIHDGPGIRTVVYLAGCGLRCAWCHNPETFTSAGKILYAPIKCIHCGRCINICPEHHVINGDDMEYIRSGCVVCGKCADACPAEALTVCGNDMSVKEVYAEVEKDCHYYAVSGGGITLSGGECLLRPEFCCELLKMCRNNGISTTVESAFFVPWSNVEKVLPFTDVFFADLKIADSNKHRKYIGQGNEEIIDNIKRLSNINGTHSVIVRIPLIPGVNDNQEDLAQIAEVINTFGSSVTGVELLRYNPLAESKYQLVGMEYHGFGNEAQSDDQMKMLADGMRNILADRYKLYYK